MNVVTRGIRNAFRNQIRTFSIVVILGLSIGMALAMLVARQAVTTKIASVKASVGNTVNVSPAGVRGFEGGGNALKAADIASLTKISHVTSVDQSLSDRLTTSNSTLQSAIDAGDLGKRFAANNGVVIKGDNVAVGGSQSADGAIRSFTPPITLVGTNAPTQLSATQGGGTFTLKSGKVFGTSSSDNSAVIGASLATKNNLKVGSTFTAYSKTVTVVGIFDAGNNFANNQVLMPLKAVQTLTSQADAITSAVIHVDSVTNIDAVTSSATKSLGDKADVTNEAAQAKEAVAPLENIQSISLYSLIGAVTAGVVIILLTMIMIVRERRREIGVLKAIGASNVTVMGQFASEAVTLTVLGAIIGIALGVVAGSPITKMLVNNASSNSGQTMIAGPGLRTAGRGFNAVGRNITNVTANVGWDIILYGLGVAILIAIIASALASFFIAKVRPAEVMRTE
ncbi:MAG TPA: FtsX-like permease family protein [Candidatus Saccharimonadales bacterium]|jgi:putative ABC transport system permease protein|nr:FtsX-like permease family protein [Candidatus Saccharimonadales bacterium]